MINNSALCECNNTMLKISSDPVVEFICHCNDCRKFTQQDFTALAFFEKQHIEISGDFTQYQVIADSGNCVTRYSCANCQSPIYETTSGVPHLLGVISECLAKPYISEPSLHVWVSEKLPNVEIPIGAKKKKHGL